MTEVTAPSNIALIKYMGKSQVSGNRPTNASLSFTLDHLVTKLTVEAVDGEDCWSPLENSEFEVQLSEKGQKRFLDFLKILKNEFDVKESLHVSSGNNFPSDCGLASSASSFAALTKGVYEYARTQNLTKERTLEELSQISQRGSGSSCRSFFSPFALWESEGARPIDLGIPGLLHAALIFENHKKEVSSSKAHVQVLTSDLFQGRVERAEKRLQNLIFSFQNEDWFKAFEVCWAEFWDMHALFETSTPSFGYFTGAAVDCLMSLRKMWHEKGDGPLVTMDAGPNIHLLFRRDQKVALEEWIATLKSQFPLMKVYLSQ